MFHNIFHGFLFWILNGKENKEVSNICCEVRTLEKKNLGNYGTIQLDKSDFSNWARAE